VARTRRPVVLVTHDPADARALADRIVPVASGRRSVPPVSGSAATS